MFVCYNILIVVMEMVLLLYYLCGIIICVDGGIFVCMMDSYSFCVFDNSRWFVVKYIKDLKFEKVFEFEENKWLFIRFYRIVENINGDICVIDKILMGFGWVVVFDCNGKFKFVFEGLFNN